MRLKILGGLLVAAFALGPLVSPASARYLSYVQAYRAAVLDSIEAKQEVKFGEWDLGVGQRADPSRVEFPVSLQGDELDHIVPGVHTKEVDEPIRFIYFHYFCGWVDVVHWRGVVVAVRKRSVACEHWYDESPTQE